MNQQIKLLHFSLSSSPFLCKIFLSLPSPFLSSQFWQRMSVNLFSCWGCTSCSCPPPSVCSPANATLAAFRVLPLLLECCLMALQVLICHLQSVAEVQLGLPLPPSIEHTDSFCLTLTVLFSSSPCLQCRSNHLRSLDSKQSMGFSTEVF